MQYAREHGRNGVPTVIMGYSPWLQIGETCFRPRLPHCSVGSQRVSQLCGKRMTEAESNPE